MKRSKINKKDLKGVTTLNQLKDKMYPPWTFRRLRYNVGFFFFKLKVKWLTWVQKKIKKCLDNL